MFELKSKHVNRKDKKFKEIKHAELNYSLVNMQINDCFLVNMNKSIYPEPNTIECRKRSGEIVRIYYYNGYPDSFEHDCKLLGI